MDSEGVLLGGYSIAFVLIAAINISLAHKTYSDLYTDARKSVRHRSVLPPIQNTTYKWNAILTLISVTGYACYNLFNILEHSIPCDKSSSSMKFNVTDFLGDASSIFAKTVLYLVLFSRLDLVYNQTAFQYSKQKLKICAGIVIGYNSIALILAAMANEAPCAAEVKNNIYVTIAAVMLVLEDFVCAIAFLLAFLLPLRRLLKSTQGAKLGEIERGKLYYMAVKATTLAIVAVTSTCLLILLTLVSRLFLIYVPDTVVNVVCITLMSVYYPDHTYYERLCCCCVKCCTPNNENYRSKVRQYVESSKNSADSSNTSVDTGDQPRQTAIKQASSSTRTGTGVSTTSERTTNVIIDELMIQSEK